MEFNSVNEILDYAIVREQNAADFYTDLAGRMDREHMKEIFLGFASEEQGHKAKLLAVKEGKQLLASEKMILDLKIGDNLVDVELASDPSYQDALILAMKAEKNAFRLYNNLANATDDANLKTLFIGLANEEAKHKLRFEIEYDDAILTEN
ncbi:MAG: ferritin family protein [candidate division Zixibacteria bacterium]|jgi:rubrerythrin|nr:ferritin family protein [candidate division Zixibacteria bacterium]